MQGQRRTEHKNLAQLSAVVSRWRLRQEQAELAGLSGQDPGGSGDTWHCRQGMPALLLPAPTVSIPQPPETGPSAQLHLGESVPGADKEQL